VAVITRLRERSAAEGWPLDLLYVGSTAGVERTAMASLGVPYAAIQTGKLRRYFSWQTPVDLLIRLPAGFLQALRHVRRFRPDVIFSTGGYVCVPTVIAGWLTRAPALTHEQTALVGLANRIAGRFATRVAISYPRSARFFPEGKTVLTGNPMRPSIVGGDAQRAAAHFGLDGAQPTLYVTGGAQGSHAINTAVRDALPRLLDCCQVVHQCGEGPAGTGEDLKMLQAARSALPPEQQARYRVQPYVGDELGDLYALASLVVGRAGAGTVNELANLGKPSVLVPLPGAAGGQRPRPRARRGRGRAPRRRPHARQAGGRGLLAARGQGGAFENGRGGAQALHFGRGRPDSWRASAPVVAPLTAHRRIRRLPAPARLTYNGTVISFAQGGSA
jgi:UDP-N-acetylglucosamine--N-acetylmuramyl-(pentapeptide) pyrophosphoryl-undecaprenol N-acetylglucosamine transferase